MRVLLVDAPYDRLKNCKVTLNYPLGLSYLTSYLNKNGHEAHYLNLDWAQDLPTSNPFSRLEIISQQKRYRNELLLDSTHAAWSDFAKAIQDFNPRLVGLTTSTLKIKSVFKCLEIVKKVNPGIRLVLGGHHSQIYAREILQNVREVDYVVLGEGEETLLALVNELAKTTHPSLNSIDGLAYRDENANIILNKRRAFISNLDALPYCAPAEEYTSGKFVPLPMIAVMGSRGCPYDCNYCATNNMWQRRVRRRSAKNVAAEIESIIATQKERFISFYDDCFTLDKKWVLEFCDILIKEKIKISWQCITSVNLLDDVVLRKIIEAGCNKINIAIESGSSRILKSANKHIDLENIKKMFTMAKRYKISTTAYIMMGFPTETRQDILLTQKIIVETKPNWVYCNVLIPLPGTKFFTQCVEQKLIDPTLAWRGEGIDEIIKNYTGTMSDEEFFALVDETFQLCYKINSRMSNLLKRVSFRRYFSNPVSLLTDFKKARDYIKCKG